MTPELKYSFPSWIPRGLFLLPAHPGRSQDTQVRHGSHRFPLKIHFPQFLDIIQHHQVRIQIDHTVHRLGYQLRNQQPQIGGPVHMPAGMGLDFFPGCGMKVMDPCRPVTVAAMPACFSSLMPSSK